MLGRFSVALGGVEIPPDSWPSLRAAHLVQLLSLAKPHQLLREQVIDALWPQLDPEAGAANLRKAAHHARQAMRHKDAVLLRGGQVVLCPGRTVVVDAAHFERRANAALAGRDPAACAEAASAYDGELLPGSQYEAWTEDGPRPSAVALPRAAARGRPVGTPGASRADGRAGASGTDETRARGRQPGRRDPLVFAPAHQLAAGARRVARIARPRPCTSCALPGCSRRGRRSSAGRWNWRRLPRGCVPSRGSGPVASWCAARPASARPPSAGSSVRWRETRAWTVVTVEAAQPDRPYAVIGAVADRLILENRAVLDARRRTGTVGAGAAEPARSPGRRPAGAAGTASGDRRLPAAAAGGVGRWLRACCRWTTRI